MSDKKKSGCLSRASQNFIPTQFSFTDSLGLSQKKNYRRERGGKISVGVVLRMQFLARGVVQVVNYFFSG